MPVFTTSSFMPDLYKKEFTREKFLDAAVAAGADTIMVGAQFFPERAMYWTRMFRADAEKRGLGFAGILCESELLIASSEAIQEAVSDLLEWIRISALSKISHLWVQINGMEPFDENRIETLSRDLQPVVMTAERYGIVLVFVDGTNMIGQNQLLTLVKKLGYTACRIGDVNEAPCENDSVWFTTNERGA